MTELSVAALSDKLLLRAAVWSVELLPLFHRCIYMNRNELWFRKQTHIETVLLFDVVYKNITCTRIRNFIAHNYQRAVCTYRAQKLCIDNQKAIYTVEGCSGKNFRHNKTHYPRQRPGRKINTLATDEAFIIYAKVIHDSRERERVIQRALTGRSIRRAHDCTA